MQSVENLVWFEDPPSKPEETSLIQRPITPAMNIEDTVWFDDDSQYENYDDYMTSSEESFEQTVPTIKDIPIMDLGWLDGLDGLQVKGKNETDTSLFPLFVTMLRSMAFKNLLEQLVNVTNVTTDKALPNSQHPYWYPLQRRQPPFTG